MLVFIRDYFLSFKLVSEYLKVTSINANDNEHERDSLDIKLSITIQIHYINYYSKVNG